MIILGIESTCDETAAALVEDGRHLLSNVISTSVKEQALYGGVVPEIASRRHCEFISATVKKALLDAGKTMEDVDAVAVTFAPGLIGAVLVGVNFAKSAAAALGIPLIPVHHIRGHIAATYLAYPELKPPFLTLIASGGHSEIVMVKSYTEFEILGAAVWFGFAHIFVDAVGAERLFDGDLFSGHITGLGQQKRANPRNSIGIILKIEWCGKVVVETVRIDRQGESGLLEIAHAADRGGALPRLIQRRQQHRGEDCDDCDHDEEFDKGKRMFFHAAGYSCGNLIL